MVLASMLRQSSKRIPLIKFRRQREEEIMAARSETSNAMKKSPSSPSSAVSLPTIEDWQLPNRYRRKPIDAAEIEYINRGGPA